MGRTPPRAVNDEHTEQVGPSTGRPSALTLLVFLDDDIHTYRLPESGVVQVGRGDDVAFQILDRSVSRVHADLTIRLVADELQVELTDLGSSNGTRLRGQALVPHQARRVGLGETIEFGTVSTVLQYSPVSASPASPTAARITTPPRDRPTPRGTQATTSASRQVVCSPVMVDLYRVAERVGASPLSVLLLGETGVGKEALAEFIHASSDRADRPLIKLNCAALPEALLESELFGHVRGSFTGADHDKLGVLEAADGGTVLLDEVGELPLATQAKILRVVERGELMRIGSLKPKVVDVRFVAATNRDLPAEATAGRFRLDLYHRLNGVTLTVPPLRDRHADLPELVRHFARAYVARTGGGDEPHFTPRALVQLEAHPWPGNVRELKHTIERALVLSGGRVIDDVYLSAVVAPSAPASTPVIAGDPPRGGMTPHAAESASVDEAQRIRDALEQCGGNQAKAAKLLAMARGTLAIRMDRYGISRPRK